MVQATRKTVGRPENLAQEPTWVPSGQLDGLRVSQRGPRSDFRELTVLDQGSHGLRAQSSLASRLGDWGWKSGLVKLQDRLREGCRVQPASATALDRPLVHSGSM